MTAAGMAGTMWDVQAAAVANDVGERGDVIVTLLPEAVAHWRKATEPVVNAWLKDMKEQKVDGDKMLASIHTLLTKYQNEPEPRPAQNAPVAEQDIPAQPDGRPLSQSPINTVTPPKAVNPPAQPPVSATKPVQPPVSIVKPVPTPAPVASSAPPAPAPHVATRATAPIPAPSVAAPVQAPVPAAPVMKPVPTPPAPVAAAPPAPTVAAPPAPVVAAPAAPPPVLKPIPAPPAPPKGLNIPL
jgi:hypothetical protein